jgi:DNA invertase Pin-like site-specific DNA recombinase/ribosomal protein L32
MFYRQSIIDILLDEVIMYLRKSRSDDPYLSVEEVLRNHQKELDDWCERNLGGTVSEDRRFKEVVSGEKISERPMIQKVLSEIEKPNVKYLIINEPTRLSRGYLDEIGKLIKLLRFNKITIITPTKIFNMEDEFDREQFERELMRGNQYLEYSKKVMKRGKDIKVADGEYIANKRPYGYQKIQYKEGRRTIKTLRFDETEAEVVKMIFNWYGNEGLTTSEIVNRLNDLKIPSPSGNVWTREGGLLEILSHPVYIGKIRWNYKQRATTVQNQEIVTSVRKSENVVITEGIHEGIIDEELFYRVQEMKRQKVPTTKRALANAFAGIIVCKKCGHKIRSHHTSKGTKRFVCEYSKCVSSGVPEEEFYEVFYDVLEKTIKDFEVKIDGGNTTEVDEHKNKIAVLEKKLNSLEQQELEQWKNQTSTNTDLRMPAHIFKQLNDSVVKEIKETKEALELLYSTAPKKVDYEEKIYSFKTAIEYLKDDSISVELKNAYLKSIISRIDFERDKLKRLKKSEAEALGIPFSHRVPCFDNPPWHMEIFFKE